jgi:hypothetical protein
MTYHYPAVALDHSTWITNVSCSGSTTLVGHFTKKSAFQYAQTKWTSIAKKKPVFVTSVSTCSADGQNAWFQVSSLSFNANDLSFTAVSQSVKMDSVCNDMKIGFGPNMNMNGHGFQGLDHAERQAKPTTVTKTVAPPSSTYGPATVVPPASSISTLPAMAAGPGFDKAIDGKARDAQSHLESTRHKILRLTLFSDRVDHLGYYYDDNHDQSVSCTAASQR